MYCSWGNFAFLRATKVNYTKVLYNENFFASKILTQGESMYMLGAKRRLGQSTDCPAQSMDLRFARQSTDCPLNPWIARIKGLKAWIWSNHGFELEDTCMPNDPSLLQYHAWIQLPPNHRFVLGLRRISSIRNWSYTAVVLVHSGIVCCMLSK